MKGSDKKRISGGIKQQKPATNTGKRTVKQATAPLRSNPSRNKRDSSAPTTVRANEVVDSVSSFEESQMEEQIAETVSSQGDSMSADDEKSRRVTQVNRVDEISNGNVSDLESNDADENGDGEDEGGLEIRVEVLENRIGKLEEELRQVAALEISLYSVTPEHGSSSHKVHTPARRLSRLYFHACKHWSPHRRGSVAKSIASGVVLIAKSCGNDVPRLTFWLSNAVVLREAISEVLGSSHKPNLSRVNGSFKQNGVKQNNVETMFVEDWQETGTLTAALEKVESWIFSRIVESVWWQSLTPHMQPPTKNSSSKNSGKSLGQANFSINLWNTAFQDAAQRLCPVRGAGHDCGCSPLIAKMVMESCVARLDVAMFNAILRESANETPTDPVSDPIIDSRVLPIPAGNLSFGSGAQLKNSIGNWSRWLSDIFEMDGEYKEHNDDDDARGDHKYFRLLSDLSDLLMLPKDMLIDRHVRQEVCPSIGISLIKRILCNFTPDEFCPDFVPGAVLESLNAEGALERRPANDALESFPYAASPVVYAPLSRTGAGAVNRFLCRNASNLQRKGYTSDEELEELSCPLTSIIDSALPVGKIGNSFDRNTGTGPSAIRYELLRQVWSE